MRLSRDRTVTSLILAPVLFTIFFVIVLPGTAKPVGSVQINVTVDRLVYVRPNLIYIDSYGRLTDYVVRSVAFTPISETSFTVDVTYFCSIFICIGRLNVTIYDSDLNNISSQATLFASFYGVSTVSFTFTGINISDVFAVAVYSD